MFPWIKFHGLLYSQKYNNWWIWDIDQEVAWGEHCRLLQTDISTENPANTHTHTHTHTHMCAHKYTLQLWGGGEYIIQTVEERTTVIRHSLVLFRTSSADRTHNTPAWWLLRNNVYTLRFTVKTTLNYMLNSKHYMLNSKHYMLFRPCTYSFCSCWIYSAAKRLNLTLKLSVKSTQSCTHRDKRKLYSSSHSRHFSEIYINIYFITVRQMWRTPCGEKKVKLVQ